MHQGTIYLLHFNSPLPGGSRHYLGWTLHLPTRLGAHAAGRGAQITRECLRLGITWEVVALWPGTRSMERRLHRRHGYARLCPCCRGSALDRYAAYERQARAAGRRHRRSRAAVTPT
jgi:hypothetical protein